MTGETKPHTPAMFLQRFEAKFIPEPNSGCWIWIAGLRTGTGYGQFRISHTDKQRLAHIISYELQFGKVPDGLQLDHKCRMRCCVNPHHLEPVTCRVNLLRGYGWSGIHARKTHCPAGHPYEGSNLRTIHGSRSCQMCNKLRAREYRNNHKEDYNVKRRAAYREKRNNRASTTAIS